MYTGFFSRLKIGFLVALPPLIIQLYTVQQNDTLSKIATKYGTTYQKLASYDGIANPNIINVGQKIRIPGSGVKTYTIKQGDSLWAIAAAQFSPRTDIEAAGSIRRRKRR